MNHTILVTYATKYGATGEIAGAIGKALIRAGFKVDVLPATRVLTLHPYSAVVLGSGVYAGSWLKDGISFLERFEEDLADRPVWIFSSGPTGEGDPATLLHGWSFPEAQKRLIERINPREIIVFHGAIDMEKLNFGDGLLIRMIRAKTGDFRDWDAIAGWGAEIGRALSPVDAVAPGRVL
jgi:menaquinone-dependent protoporphyrinogen oxidase